MLIYNLSWNHYICSPVDFLELLTLHCLSVEELFHFGMINLDFDRMPIYLKESGLPWHVKVTILQISFGFKRASFAGHDIYNPQTDLSYRLEFKRSYNLLRID